MNRRDFLATTLSGLCALSCGRATDAMAKPVTRGCRIAGAGASAAGLKGDILKTTGDTVLDRSCQAAADLMIATFAVRPGWCLYNDADAPNALAVPDVIFPDATGGTVMIGKSFLTSAIALTESKIPGEDILWSLTPDQARERAIFIIMAHEFGHIHQYKKGYKPDGPWQMEPHADFMAGWFLSQVWNKPIEKTMLLQSAAMTLFDLGDTAFNDKEHHGEPEFRAAMVQAGYDARNLGVEHAFEKGRQLANLIGTTKEGLALPTDAYSKRLVPGEREGDINTLIYGKGVGER